MTDKTIPERNPELEGLRHRLTHAPDWQQALDRLGYALTDRERTEMSDRRLPFRHQWRGPERRKRRGVLSR